MTSYGEAKSFYYVQESSGYKQDEIGGYHGSYLQQLPPMFKEDDDTIHRRKQKRVKEWLFTNAVHAIPQTEFKGQPKGHRPVPRWPKRYDVKHEKFQVQVGSGQREHDWSSVYDDVTDVKGQKVPVGHHVVGRTVESSDEEKEAETQFEAIKEPNWITSSSASSLPHIPANLKALRETQFEDWGRVARYEQRKINLETVEKISETETVLFKEPEIEIQDLITGRPFHPHPSVLPRKHGKRKVMKEGKNFETSLASDSSDLSQIGLLNKSQKRLLLAKKYPTTNDDYLLLAENNLPVEDFSLATKNPINEDIVSLAAKNLSNEGEFSLVPNSLTKSESFSLAERYPRSGETLHSQPIESHKLTKPKKTSEFSESFTSSSTVEEWEKLEPLVLGLFEDFNQKEVKEKIIRARFGRNLRKDHEKQKIISSAGKDQKSMETNSEKVEVTSAEQEFPEVEKLRTKGKESSDHRREDLILDLRDLQLFQAPTSQTQNQQNSQSTLSPPSRHQSNFHPQGKENLNDDNFRRPLRAKRILVTS